MVVDPDGSPPDTLSRGTPEEVLTVENIKTVYDVESEVVVSHGRPHIIMLDPEFDDDVSPLDEETFIRKI